MEHLQTQFVARHEQEMSRAGTLGGREPAGGLTAFSLPVPHRRRLRTANIVERLNEELRRRMRAAALFPNEASYLRSVSAIVMEIAED